jgi:soluble P-type ATPase
MATVAVAVVDDETPAEVAEAADIVVSGPRQALGLLRWLAESASPTGRG